jgi:hypothetical protein
MSSTQIVYHTGRQYSRRSTGTEALDKLKKKYCTTNSSKKWNTMDFELQ